MARVKRNRERSIIHFSFFDLLFGALGAFIFLMIMQIISTINLVDEELVQLVNDTAKENSLLRSNLGSLQGIEEKFIQTNESLKNLRAKYKIIIDERNKLKTEKSELTAQIASLKNELASMAKIEREINRRGDILKTLEREKAKLENRVSTLERRLAAVKSIPLRVKTTSLPTGLTQDSLHLALAAEGGAPPYSWEITGELPTGLDFDIKKGIISGIVKEEGDYSFSLEVSDAVGTETSLAKPIIWKIIERPRDTEEARVNPAFVIVSVIASLLLIYILIQKYKSHSYYKKMKREGWELVWQR